MYRVQSTLYTVQFTLCSCLKKLFRVFGEFLLFNLSKSSRWKFFPSERENAINKNNFQQKGTYLISSFLTLQSKELDSDFSGTSLCYFQ